MKIIEVAYLKGDNYDEAIQGRLYSYRTELDLVEGDILHVPTGKDNNMKRVIIGNVTEDKEFPYPIKEVGVACLIHTVRENSIKSREEGREVIETIEVQLPTTPGYIQL